MILYYPWAGGKGEPITEDGFSRALDILGCEPELIWALANVESSGCGFLRDGRPKIRFEYNVFLRLSGTRNLFGQGAGYSALEDAYHDDHLIAMKSTSWGICQVMGFNYEIAGYRVGGVEAMVRSMSDSEDAQMLAMANFCMKSGAADALREFDFTEFASIYNGPQYKKNQYDSKLKDEFERVRKHRPDIKIRSEQVRLMYKGIYMGKIDGIFSEQLQEARANGAAVSQA